MELKRSFLLANYLAKKVELKFQLLQTILSLLKLSLLGISLAFGSLGATAAFAILSDPDNPLPTKQVKFS